MKKEFGFLPELDIVKEEDFIFGKAGGIVDDFTLPDNETWFDHYSQGEYQFSNRYESFSCVTYSKLENIEAIFNAKKKRGLFSIAFILWAKEKGYINDRGEFDFMEQFTAKLSNTDRKGGNSGGDVADAIRNYGLIPQSLRPYRKDMSRAEYYKYPSREEFELGREWNEWIDFKYERVRAVKRDMVKALKHSPLQVFVYAWPIPVNGVYGRTGRTTNHAVSNGQPEWRIRDSYTKDARFGQDFDKQLAPNFNFWPWAYKYQVLEIKNNMSGQSVPVVRNGDSPEHGLYIKLDDANVLKNLKNVFQLDDVKIDDNGRVDWKKTKVSGKVEMFDYKQAVKVKSFWERLFNNNSR